jgi:3-oxoacyl-[acyl-carrier protein] reductase
MIDQTLSLDGKIAIVTGGSRGIGRAIALELAKRGAHVVINFHASQADALEVQELIDANGGTATVIQADVSDYVAAQMLVTKTLETYQRVDILVNNAGIGGGQFLLKMSEQDWDHMLKTNLYSAFHCCKAVVKPMMRQRSEGRIINIASIAGIIGKVKESHYAASKAGLIGFTKALARELASSNVTVNGVAPGLIRTHMTQTIPQEELNRVVQTMIPLQRIGTPEDIAYTVAFLASAQAAYITGQILCVDGGFTM